MKHLTDDELSAYLDGACRGHEAETLGRHLAGCAACREALAAIAAQDDALKPALSHDPGDAYFENFAARVEGRLRAADLAGAGARPEGFDFGRLFRSPRALAWTGAVAVVVAGGGLALMISREGSPPGLMRDSEMSQRLEGAPPPGTGRLETRESAPAGPAPAEGTRLDERERAAAPRQAPKEADLSPPQRGRNDENYVVVPDKNAANAPTSSTAPSPADSRTATQSRAYEVQRTPAGEEVALKRAPAPAAPQSSAATGAANENKVHKKAQAGPLQKSDAGTRQETQPGAVGASKDEVPFAQPPQASSTAGVTKSALPQSVEVQVCGDVRDVEGRPIPGAQVTVSDLGRGATTDAQGRFCVSAPGGEHELSIMAVGYKPSRRPLRVEGPLSDVRVMLPAVAVLEGVDVAAKKRVDTKSSAPTTRMTEASPGALDAVALPDTLRQAMREAERLEADGAARRSASQHDAAANIWERSLRQLPATAGPNLALDVRRRLAAARYHAWEIQPDDRRARAATDALEAYVSRAPAGPERTQASEWLKRVRR